MHKAAILLSLILILLLVCPHWAFSSAAFSSGDRLSYHEIETVSNGTGSYSGYADQTTVNGGEQMEVVRNSSVSANYSYSYSFSDNQGSSTATSQGGSFTWSDLNFQYLNSTDGEVGYLNPTVWFAMNASLPVGGAFESLNTQMTVISKNASFYLPSQNEYVATIYAQGSGSYTGSPQDNAYGNFSAKYVWNEYFDPTTGYIIGYHYVEQDTSTNGNGTGFGYVDDLYVTSTSYLLTVVSSASVLSSTQNVSTTSTLLSTSLPSSTATQITSSSSTTSSSASSFSVEDIAIIAIVVIVIVATIAISRRGKSGEDRIAPAQTSG